MNNREAMQEAFETCERYAGRDFAKTNGVYADDGVQHEFGHFLEGYQAALASQAQQPAFPPRDLTKPAEQQGMFSKFHVERVDGSSAKGGKHHGCRYWVLDLDHDKHAPAAMRGYAEDCKETHPILSAEIFAEFGMQSQAHQTECQAARLQAAIEGECNGLAVDLQTAQRILNYVSLPPAPEGGE